MISSLPGPANWIDAALDCVHRRQRAVLAMVTDERGSAPRDAGSWMLLTNDSVLGTIGGGELERTLIEAARAMLEGGGAWSRAAVQCALGPDMRQCCGGVVQVLLEPIDANAAQWLAQAQQQLALTGHVQITFDSAACEISPVVNTDDTLADTLSPGIITLSFQENRPRLALFGAGHVGRALCTIASQLPIQVTVFDARPDQCVQVPGAANLFVDERFDPVGGAQQLQNYEAALVMTHSHALDYDLCRILLRRPDLVYTGLIGSESKSRRFRKALRKDGLHDLELARLTSPIGKDGPDGKEPGIIAMSVLSEILTACQRAQDRPQSSSATATPLSKAHHG